MTTFNNSIQSAIDTIILNTYTDKDGQYTSNGVRSSKQRTEPFHEAVIASIRDELGNPEDLTFVCEYGITDCYGKRFKVDIAVFRGEELIAVILVKAVNGDYNRNRNNYMAITNHETLRIVAPRKDGSASPYENIQVLFLNFIPTIQADYNNQGALLRYQYVNTCEGNFVLQHISPNATIIDVKFRNHVNVEDSDRCKSDKRPGSLRQDGLGCILTNKRTYFDRYVEMGIGNRITVDESETEPLRTYIQAVF